MATHPAGRGDGCAVPPWGSPESVAAAVKGKQERRAPRPTPPVTEGHASLLVARQLRLPAQRRSWLGPSGRPGLACAAGNSPQLCSLLSKKKRYSPSLARSPHTPPPTPHTHTCAQTPASRTGPSSTGRRRPPSPSLVSKRRERKVGRRTGARGPFPPGEGAGAVGLRPRATPRRARWGTSPASRAMVGGAACTAA